jgi:hypothetical protein
LVFRSGFDGSILLAGMSSISRVQRRSWLSNSTADNTRFAQTQMNYEAGKSLGEATG